MYHFLIGVQHFYLYILYGATAAKAAWQVARSVAAAHLRGSPACSAASHARRRAPRADNDSTDSPLTELQPLIKRGIVTYIPWPGEKGEAQGKQLHDCFNPKRVSDARWMAGIDIGASPAAC